MGKSFKPFEPRVIQTEVQKALRGALPPANTFVPAEEDWNKIMKASGMDIPPKDVFIQGLKAPHYVK